MKEVLAVELRLLNVRLTCDYQSLSSYYLVEITDCSHKSIAAYVCHVHQPMLSSVIFFHCYSPITYDS